MISMVWTNWSLHYLMSYSCHHVLNFKNNCDLQFLSVDVVINYLFINLNKRHKLKML